MNVSVIIPALNEASSIALVLREIPRKSVSEILVVDNGSDDDTGRISAQEGARVVREERRGYGWACLAGIAALASETDTIVFLDGDHSDYPEDLPALLAPISEGRAELVIGSRTLGARERGALTPQQRFGNWLATRLIRILWGVRYTDLGPFRAVTRSALERMRMEDTTYGWTVEMQIRAAKLSVPVAEVPVRYRKRIGKSKISGTLKGTLLAGCKILIVIGKEARKQGRAEAGKDGKK